MSNEKLVHEALNELVKSVDELGDCFQTPDPTRMAIPGKLALVAGAVSGLRRLIDRAIHRGCMTEKIQLAAKAGE